MSLRVILLLTCLVYIKTSVNTEQDYSDFITKITKIVNNDKGRAYKFLAELTDHYGPRLFKSKAQVLSAQFIRDYVKEINDKDKLNLKLETGNSWPIKEQWVRGEETLTLHSPRYYPQKLGCIGLGNTVPTNGSLKAEVLVVQHFSELTEAPDYAFVKKIVLVNQKFTDYSHTVPARTLGASEAAKKGAIGYLVRSVTPDSVYSVHAGVTQYEDNYKIPALAITLEDADMLQRMQDRGQRIVVEMNVTSKTQPVAKDNKTTENIVVDLVGQDNDKYVVLGGHIDSWDTGAQTGANDDGGGFVVCLEALRALALYYKAEGKKPKYTIRFIGWVGEEFGNDDSGNIHYANNISKNGPKASKENHIMAFESDEGTYEFFGLGFKEQPYLPYADLKKVFDNPKNVILGLNHGKALSFVKTNENMVDAGFLYDNGIAVTYNIIDDDEVKSKYFTYHHTAGDSMSIMIPTELDSNVHAIAAFVNIIQDSYVYDTDLI